MRRLLKEVATSGVARGDTTTLEDVTVLTRLAATAKRRVTRSQSTAAPYFLVRPSLSC